MKALALLAAVMMILAGCTTHDATTDEVDVAAPVETTASPTPSPTAKPIPTRTPAVPSTPAVSRTERMRKHREKVKALIQKSMLEQKQKKLPTTATTNGS